MTPGLRNTLVGSFALAGLLNVIQMTADFSRDSKAAFSPAWAQAPVTAATGDAAKSTTAPAPTIAAVAPAAAPAAADPVTPIQARLAGAGLKPDHAALYLAAEQKTGTPWQLIAAVHKIETGQRGDTAITSYAGAKGPMQFMPATFRAYSLDGDGDGTKSITDVDDAVFSGANYLRASGADRGRYTAALYNYNHSNAYVGNVMSIARRLGL